MHCLWHSNVQYYQYSESVNTNEADSNNELVQTNKNLSSAMEKLEARCRLLEEKSEKLKKFKNIVLFCLFRLKIA